MSKKPGDPPAPNPACGVPAETTFLPIHPQTSPPTLEAIPATGRTHQIRVHAAAAGFPILGDTLYAGTPAARLHLHAAEITLNHPHSNQPVSFSAPVDWSLPPSLALRNAIIDPTETNAFRLHHGAADADPGWYLDRLGPFLLAQSESAPDPQRAASLAALHRLLGTQGSFYKSRLRQPRQALPANARPQPLDLDTPPTEIAIRENGLEFRLQLDEGYSTGLFLDQRDNRRRLLVNHVAARFPAFPTLPSQSAVLNLFAYTCAFSVCAAVAGAHTTSVDLSRRYLEWGKRNFTANGIDPTQHAFLYGDAFDWLRRFARQSRLFQVVLLDPPTFSTSRRSGQFRAEHDFGALVDAALRVLAPDGVLFAATNAARLPPEPFLDCIHATVRRAGRRTLQYHFCPQPPDFPVTRTEPAHLKTAWLRVA